MGNKCKSNDEDLKELITVQEKEDTDEVEGTQEAEPFDLEFLYKQIKIIQDVADRFVEQDPSMECALISKRQLELAIKPYVELRNQLRQQQSQSKITMFFNRCPSTERSAKPATSTSHQPLALTSRPSQPGSPDSDSDNIDETLPLSPQVLSMMTINNNHHISYHN